MAGMATFTPILRHARFYDDGTESGSAAAAAEDTNHTATLGSGNVQLHYRCLIEETGGANGATSDDWKIQYSKNSGTWTDVTTGSSNVQVDTGSSLTDGGATTNRATDGLTDPGTGSFIAGGQEEGNGEITNHRLTADNFTEHVFALLLIDADLANNDTLDFRILLNGVTPPFTDDVNLRATIDKSAFTLTAAQGSHTLTGQSAGLLAGRLVTGAQGSHTLSGQSASLNLGYALAADQGSYALNGQAAGFIVARVLAAGQGSYAVAGQAANLLRALIMASGQGFYALSGPDVTFSTGFIMAAAQGAYALSGQSAGLVAARSIDATQGSYTLTGIDADLLASGFIVVAAPGTYVLTGRSAELIYSAFMGTSGPLYWQRRRRRS